jgi:hypothetical protein
MFNMPIALAGRVTPSSFTGRRRSVTRRDGPSDDGSSNAVSVVVLQPWAELLQLIAYRTGRCLRPPTKVVGENCASPPSSTAVVSRGISCEG